MEMVSMEREGGETMNLPTAYIPSPYPCGLRLNITLDDLKKLGYDELPPAGTMCKIEALACVVRATSEDPDADGDCDYCCIELQITEMGMEEESEPEEDRDEEREHTAHKLYGGEKK